MDNPHNCTPLEGMELGDLVNLDCGETSRYEVMKVPGGWIFTRIEYFNSSINERKDISQMSSAFVPENKPFIFPTRSKGN